MLRLSPEPASTTTCPLSFLFLSHVFPSYINLYISGNISGINRVQIGRGRPVDIMVPPAEVKNLEADLAGLAYELMIPDVQKLIDLEKRSMAGSQKADAG